jgi:hypothetical protein
MAHMLVHQQTHRSSNISIHRSTSSQKESPLPMVHSVDERLFLHDSTQLIKNLLTRFASEPHMSKYHTQSINSNGHTSNSPVLFALSSPATNSCLQVDEPEDEIHFDDIIYSNCDKIQPVSTSLIEDLNSDKIDNVIMMSTTAINLSSDQVTPINDDFKSQQLEEDVLLDTSPYINGNDTHCERHFRRRKRRSSLTKNSISLDDTQSTVNLLEKIDINQQSSQEVSEHSELKQNDNKQDTNVTETNTSENQASDQISIDDEKSASVSRYRGRSKLIKILYISFIFFLLGLRHRFYRQSAAASSPQEVITNTSPEFYISNEALNAEAPRLHSPPPLSPVTVSPLPSPTSPPLTIISNQASPSTFTSGLKRTNSMGTTKKSVRFADSVGRELAQVQFIRSSITDESKELSFLFGSSLLSSSPPSFTKNNLYVPNKSHLEHKPWSFDVALTPNKQTDETLIPKRFFCLYRQPNSEHPDIYLHEIWKSQIKLEYADVPLKFSSTGEQQLVGKLWVTNASYWKYVSIKYTFNRWLNTCEREAQHRYSSKDFRNIDQFEFSIDIPGDVDRIDFVLRYCVNGQEYWDSNEGKNYTLQTESAYTPSTTISLPHDCDFDEMRFY